MAPIHRDKVASLKCLTPVERTALEASGLRTRTEVAAAAAKDGLGRIAARTPVKREHLRDALAGYVLGDAAGKTRPVARFAGQAWANWREIVLLLMAALGGYGVVRWLGHPERHVVAARDLAPFQVIGAADVKATDSDIGFGVYARGVDVEGRVPLQVIRAGEPLRKDQLSGVQFAQQSGLEGRQIVSLPVPRQSAALAVARSRVTLLLSPRPGAAGDGSGVMLKDVIVLGTQVTGDSSLVVVAVGEAQLSSLTRLLGSTQVTVVQPVVPPAQQTQTGRYGTTGTKTRLRGR